MEPPFQIIKVSGEGSSSPFIARLFFGLLRFRDQIYLLGTPQHAIEITKAEFDRKFKPLIEASQAARDAAVEMLQVLSAHIQTIDSGHAVNFRGNQYEILESIDAKLSQSFDKLIDQAIVATKGSLQPLLRDLLALDIGFFFQKEEKFQMGIAQLRAQGEPALAAYLEQARARWHSDLQDLRAQHEHEGWTLPGLKYGLIAEAKVAVAVPPIHGMPLPEFVQATANRVLLFVEDLVAHAMLRRCDPLFLVEIPPEARNPLDPARFRLAPRGLDRSPPWEIYYREGRDFV